MRKGITWLAMALAILMTVGLVGCQPGGGGTAGPIKIGAVVSVTGPNAPLGEGEKATLEMLAAEVNAAGGINGQQVEIIIEDDASDPAKAQAAVCKLIEQDKVVAVIGGTGTPSTMSMIPETEKAGLPQMAMAAGIPITNPLKANVFRTPPSDKVAAQKVMEYLKSQNVKAIAILHDSNAFGSSGKDQITAMSKEAGLKITATESYETAVTDLTAQLNKINGTKPEVVVVWGTNPGPAIAVKTMRELGMKQPFVGSHGIANKTFIDLAGEGKSAAQNPANGVVFPAGSMLIPDSIDAASPQRAVVDKFIKDFEAKTGKKPNTFAGHAWDAFMMLTQAIKTAGSTDPKAVRDAVEQTKDFAGIGGVFTYSATDHDGLTTENMIMVKIENGDWTQSK